MSLVESMGAQRSDAHAWWSLVAPSAAAGRRVTDSASPGSAWIHRRPAFARPSAYWKSERCTSNDDSCTGIVHIRSAKGGALCANRAPRQTARSGTRGRRNSGTKPYLLRRFGQARTPNTARASHLSEWGRSALTGYLRDDPARGDGRATRDPSRQRARALALERRRRPAPRCDGEADHH